MIRKFFPLSKVEWMLLAGTAWLSFDVFILGIFGYVGSGEYGEVFVPALIANKVWRSAGSAGSTPWHSRRCRAGSPFTP